MAQHDIEVEIRSNGEVKIHVRGAKGKRCMSYVEWFEQWVGPARELRHTHEYYEPEGKVRIDERDTQRVQENGA